MDPRSTDLSYRTATLFVTSSASDYEASRCLFLNNLDEKGGLLGAYCLEKMMKAVLWLNDNSFNYKDSKLYHSLPVLAQLITDKKLFDLSNDMTGLDRIQTFFKLRYHDNKIGRSITFGTLQDLFFVDQIYIKLSDGIKMPMDLKVRCGIRSRVFQSVPFGAKNWIFPKNYPLIEVIEGWITDIESTEFGGYIQYGIQNARSSVAFESSIEREPILPLLP